MPSDARSEMPSHMVGGERVQWIDGVKGMLIFFVVLGHMIRGGTAAGNPLYGWTHYLIYAVHMPAFIFISGLLSTREHGLKSLIRSYLLPYILVNALAWVLLVAFGKFAIAQFLRPWVVSWYILTLFFYKTPLFERHSGAMLALSLAVTMVMPIVSKDVWYVMSFGRTFMLYPLYYLARRTSIQDLEPLRRHRGALAILFCCGLLLQVALAKCGIVSLRWATHDYPHDHLEIALKYVYEAVAVVTVLFVSTLPAMGNDLLRKWGRNSLCVYLFHMFILEGLALVVPVFSVWMVPLVLALSAAITATLASDTVKRAFVRVIDLMATPLDRLPDSVKGSRS